jgi:hypothetical protein
MIESKYSATKVARLAMVLVGLVAALAALQALIAQPAQSSSFSKIAFHSNRDGNYELYSMNYDGTGLRRLTNNTAADRGPG